MIDPILYTIRLGGIALPIRWYGLLIVTGTLVGAWYAAWYMKQKDQDPDIVWDALIWLLISGIVGARIWYVVADIIGGNTRYLDDPGQIVQVWQGGLNILGGIMVAGVVGWYYTKRNHVDFWLLADATGPAVLIGQAIGRWGNFINQELYGPPTTLPWGISIDAAHRLGPVERPDPVPAGNHALSPHLCLRNAVEPRLFCRGGVGRQKMGAGNPAGRPVWKLAGDCRCGPYLD